MLTACGETSSKDQKRTPRASNVNANGTIEQCSGDKERNASDPRCSSSTRATGDPGFTAMEKTISVRPGSSATVTLQSKPTNGVTVLQFGVGLYSNDGYSAVEAFPPQFTTVSYGNARFCVYVPSNILPGEYKAKFFAKGTEKGTEKTFDDAGQTIDIPFKVEGSIANLNATLAKTCPDTKTISSKAAPGTTTPSSQD